MPATPTVSALPADAGRRPTPAVLWSLSAAVGLIGGGLALGYYGLLRLCLWIAWGHVERLDIEHLGFSPAFRPRLLVVTTGGGLLVGLVLRWLGKPGEIAAVVDNIHMAGGRIDPRQTPSMVAASLASITAGGSAGPEAPLVQILGSFGSAVGGWLRLNGEAVRTLTFCGMASALGAFFGAPLGGALFALEIPHRRGLEYYEALMPAVLAATVAFLAFRSVVGYAGPIYHVQAPPDISIGTVLVGVGAGVLGGAVGWLFIRGFRKVEHVLGHGLAHRPIVLATVGGLGVGLIAQVAPLTLFWGEQQLNTVIGGADALRAARGVGGAVGVLLLLAVLKSVAVGVTLGSGFRGGFIFPLFFIGGCVGLAAAIGLSAVDPRVPTATVVLCTMAATNVAVTKTPISTAVIVASLSGSSCLPALVAATMTSLLMTTRTSLIGTQRSRDSQ